MFQQQEPVNHIINQPNLTQKSVILPQEPVNPVNLLQEPVYPFNVAKQLVNLSDEPVNVPQVDWPPDTGEIANAKKVEMKAEHKSDGMTRYVLQFSFLQFTLQYIQYNIFFNKQTVSVNFSTMVQLPLSVLEIQV